MFVFLAIFIVFLLYINFLMHKNKRAQENLEKQFWDREHSANFTRKKDISNLNYLIITEDKIPQNLTTDAKKSLETLCGQKMLNLSSMVLQTWMNSAHVMTVFPHLNEMLPSMPRN